MDWKKFCNSKRIEFNETGSSAARGYINIHCPMCGDADTSRHLGLHKRGNWTCYRDPKGHRGKDPGIIIMRLLGCNYDTARSYVSDEYVELSDFAEAGAEFMEIGKDEIQKNERVLKLPDEFRPLISKQGRAKMYWNYLVEERGFRNTHIRALTKRYNVHYCDKGEWRGRIIFPVQIDEKLISWTGRTVYDTEKIRYKSLSHREGKLGEKQPTGLISIRDLLFNFDTAIKRRYKVCVLVEGPLDAVNVDFFGYYHGITAVGTFGTGIRQQQLDLLARLNERCDKLVLCGDQKAEGNIMDLMSATYDMRLSNVALPRNVGDPAELNEKQIMHLFGKL